MQSKRLIVTRSNGSSKECEKIYTSSKVIKKQKDEKKIIVREDQRLLKIFPLLNNVEKKKEAGWKNGGGPGTGEWKEPASRLQGSREEAEEKSIGSQSGI